MENAEALSFVLSPTTKTSTAQCTWYVDRQSMGTIRGNNRSSLGSVARKSTSSLPTSCPSRIHNPHLFSPSTLAKGSPPERVISPPNRPSCRQLIARCPQPWKTGHGKCSWWELDTLVPSSSLNPAEARRLSMRRIPSPRAQRRESSRILLGSCR